ncbi:hypothetical protein B9Z55_019218 [Caenorhabditis nigoni]|uniref:Uncharacterized protein n=2 Tax=Caenorhabditis nigoni TaxID=1611254 RepID=A0A2G5TI50_9PELO|nr:hypothetical protein B9Z55_019218 [Caenorhabditis nigoni]
MYYVNLIWISVSCLSFVFNMIVLFLAVERHHDRLEAKILAVDPDYQSILDTYHPIIIDMKSATIPMNILLLEGVWAALLYAILVFYGLYRIFYAIYKNQRIVSERVTKAQINIFITLFIYGITFFGLIGFPTVAASTAIVAGVDVKYWPFGGVYFISLSVPATLFCIINILTISPYRRAIRNLFRRLVHISNQSSVATVSGNRNAVVQVPQSLFTRQQQSNPQAVQQN